MHLRYIGAMDGTQLAPAAVSSLAAHPERLAQHAIGLLTADLRQRFGIGVQMGIELEFGMELKPDAPSLKRIESTSDPLQLGKQGDARLFPHSRLFSYAYREEGSCHAPHALRQYEVVSDHRHPMPLRHLPAAITAMRRELSQGGNPAARPSTDTHAISRARHQRGRQGRFYGHNVVDIRFDTSPRDHICHGMHLNISLVDAQDGAHRLYEGHAETDRLIACTKRLFDRHRDLIVHTDGQALRWSHEFPTGFVIHPRAVAHTQKAPPGIDEAAYIENKMPGADANPYYAVLLQLVAAHQAVAAPTASFSLTDTLNMLEPALGDRFMAAVALRPELKTCHHAPPVWHGRA